MKPRLGLYMGAPSGPDPIAAAVTGAELLRELGAEVTNQELAWGKVEPTAGVRDWAQLEEREAIAAVTPVPDGVYLLWLVHMNERGVLPADLQDVPFDSPEMRARFESFVADAAVRAGWADGEPVVLIGNEVDIWAGAHPDEVDAFCDLAAAGAEAIRRAAPRAKVVNSVTYETIQKPDGARLISRLNEATDLVAFTYYGDAGLGHSTTDGARPVETMADVVANMEAVAGGKPLLLLEVGAATRGPAGTEETQAERVHQLFDVLEASDRDRIEAAMWLGPYDWPEDFMRGWLADQFPTMAEHEGFFLYLTSLGLCRSDGTPKPGLAAWRERAAAWRS